MLSAVIVVQPIHRATSNNMLPGGTDNICAAVSAAAVAAALLAESSCTAAGLPMLWLVVPVGKMGKR
jgi:type IV secretory pathway TrbD component